MGYGPRLSRRALLAVLACGVLPVRAEAYPSRPLQLICPFPAGSASDILTRQYSEELGKVLRGAIVVVNKPGAGGLIGTKFVASAAPDGYTLLAGSIGTHVFNPAINSATSYDPIKDFVPVSRTAALPNVLVVRARLPVVSVQDLLGLSRSSATPLTYGTGGNGTTSHIAAAQFAALTGTRFLAVNFQGTPAAVTEQLAGRIDIVFGNISVVLPHIRAGGLRALAIASGQRFSMLPAIPTFNELGMPEMEMSVWSGIFLPAGTPGSIAAMLNQAIRTAAQSGPLQHAYERAGATVEVDSSPEAFGAFMRSDIEKWVPIVTAMGISVQ